MAVKIKDVSNLMKIHILVRKAENQMIPMKMCYRLLLPKFERMETLSIDMNHKLQIIVQQIQMPIADPIGKQHKRNAFI